MSAPRKGKPASGYVCSLMLFAACSSPATHSTAPRSIHSTAPHSTHSTAAPADVQSPCIDLEAFDGEQASLLVHLDAEISALSSQLQRPLCISEAGGLSLSGEREPRMRGEISIRDASANMEVTVRVWARRIPGTDARWEARFFSSGVAQELALAHLPVWLRSQNSLRSFSRTELVPGKWLLWLRHADDSTLCLDTPGEALQCWREPRQVTRVVPYGWTHHTDDAGSDPEGFVAVFRDIGQPVFSALRTHPELSRAHARSQPILVRARPSWWPSPHRIEPSGVVATPQWRALAPAEAPDLGPLRWLAAKSLHIQGGGRVVERQDSIVVAQAGSRRMLCARQAGWTCSVVLDVEGGSDSDVDVSDAISDLEDEYLDAFDLDGTSFALVRSVRRPGEAQGSGSGAAHLEVWERQEALELRGSVQVGRATWRVAEDAESTRPIERVLHSLRVESDMCLRIDAAATAHGQMDLDFNAHGEHVPLNLARAPQRIEFASAHALLDLGGSWRVDASGLTRVSDCEAQPRTLLVPVEIPPHIDARAAACLAVLNERIDELPAVRLVEGNVCGATHSRDGVIMGRERFRYDGDRRVEIVRVTRIQPRDESRYVVRERLFWRGARRAGDDYESVHYRAGEEECRDTHSRRDTLDRYGRPTRIRFRVQPCEGDPQTHNIRRSWRRGEGFDVEAHDSEEHFYLPSYAEVAVEVICTHSGCFCDVDVRDESAQVRMRLDSGNPSARVEYLYDCPTQPWPESSEALRQLSIDVTFEEDR